MCSYPNFEPVEHHPALAYTQHALIEHTLGLVVEHGDARREAARSWTRQSDSAAACKLGLATSLRTTEDVAGIEQYGPYIVVLAGYARPTIELDGRIAA